MEKKKAAIVECMLFVAGEPVNVRDLQRALDDDTAQRVSNSDYIEYVEALLQPEQKKSVSQSIMETLAVIAYKQPVTRAEIEAVRGVRCEYAVSQLQKLGLIAAVGRKDVIGKPMLYATTDTFLHKFGLHNLSELPSLPLEDVGVIETV